MVSQLSLAPTSVLGVLKLGVLVLKMRKWLGQLARLDAQSSILNFGGLRNDRLGRQPHAFHEPHH